ncbi:CPBP family intramembrane glutamic endopeptidase [Sphingorhabdus arenilitoris]|uniref:CPBP family intramembrane glutamic endopeptidase n=1 Tax=Sphingorhabdus arenilitoris TaxID=1490041 RepID=A0ABV8RDB8_9SPHN
MTIDVRNSIMDGQQAPNAGKPFPGLLVSFIWIVIFFVLQITASIIAVASTILASGRANELVKNPELLSQDMSLIAMPTIWSLVISNLITLGMLMVYLAQKGRLDIIRFNNWSELNFSRTIIIGVMVVAIALGFNYIYSEFIIPGIELQADLKMLFDAIPDTLFNTILLFIMVAILAPVLEEFLFRGLLQNALKHRMPVYAAIAVSAAIFSLAHVNWFAADLEFYIFPPIFILGAAFGYLYHVTGSLRTCIILHIINNSAALLIGFNS